MPNEGSSLLTPIVQVVAVPSGTQIARSAAGAVDVSDWVMHVPEVELVPPALHACPGVVRAPQRFTEQVMPVLVPRWAAGAVQWLAALVHSASEVHGTSHTEWVAPPVKSVKAGSVTHWRPQPQSVSAAQSAPALTPTTNSFALTQPPVVEPPVVLPEVEPVVPPVVDEVVVAPVVLLAPVVPPVVLPCVVPPVVELAPVVPLVEVVLWEPVVPPVVLEAVVVDVCVPVVPLVEVVAVCVPVVPEVVDDALVVLLPDVAVVPLLTPLLFPQAARVAHNVTRRLIFLATGFSRSRDSCE